MKETWLAWDREKREASYGDFSHIRLIIHERIETLNLISKWIFYIVVSALLLVFFYVIFSAATFRELKLFWYICFILLGIIVGIYVLLFMVGVVYNFSRNIFEFFKKEFYHDLYHKITKNKHTPQKINVIIGSTNESSIQNTPIKEPIIKYGPSKSEDVLYEAMKDIGLEPERQYEIGTMHVDFAFPKKRIVVEVDGHYHRTQEQHMKDNNRSNMLVEFGWKPIRITSEEVMEDPTKQAYKIKHHLSKKRNNTLKDFQ